MLTWQSKYQLVGQQVASLSGTLVDVGARDRILQGFIPSHLKYLSADIIAGHDLLWNLEEPLPVADSSYDVVVALDVLEHLENIHQAYREMLRVARYKLFVSLPNMTCFSWRLLFFKKGYLSGKYDLLPNHQGDRHRWLTSYPQVCHFINHHAQAVNASVKQYDIVAGYDRYHNLLARFPLPLSLRTYTILFEITRCSSQLPL